MVPIFSVFDATNDTHGTANRRQRPWYFWKIRKQIVEKLRERSRKCLLANFREILGGFLNNSKKTSGMFNSFQHNAEVWKVKLLCGPEEYA